MQKTLNIISTIIILIGAVLLGATFGLEPTQGLILPLLISGIVVLVVGIIIAIVSSFCVKYKNKILLCKTVFSVISVILIYCIILSNNRLNLFKLEATPGFEPGIRVLQTRALPLGYVAV